VEGGRVLANVGVHLKGMGSFRSVDEKASFAVKFDKFVPAQKYFGLTKLMFNNSVQDPTCLAELLATGLFRDAGLPAARVTHARVQLNERDRSLRRDRGDEQAVSQAAFKSARAIFTKATYRILIRHRSRRRRGKDQADVRALLAACTIPDLSERFKRLSAVLDVDRFVSFAAMEM
jgi:spore coat protein CotH